MRVSRRAVRRGLSLLEVIIALAIFLFSLIAVSRLFEIGADMAREMDLRVHASLLAQSKLAEIAAGSIALGSQGETPFEGDDADWSWKVDAEQESTAGLWRVVVSVSRMVRGARMEVAFAQYVLDPKLRGSTDATALGTDDTSTTSGSTTGGTTNP
jgi:type II secretion system protein I